ncbi:hypothetical protein EW146_g4364 [Bondarzewia mesenterica]|uniref:Uncharacterized protein n=1 Tax=Bondarzewia mesenterica TaxID=1095465 RepID=A0A4S4M0K5_9AGAM|nr:hypothetical protein EW146_g4364 [Bondarzewia mesenterica]
MLDIRVVAFILTFMTVFFGTISSVKNNSYLDTSNPLLTALPHPLHSTHYFASKTNLFNIIFLKRAWAWTSVFFLFHICSSPPRTHRFRRAVQFTLATASWLVFTTWFFGPALLERLITASGGECVLHLPGTDGAYVTLPSEYCFNRTRVSPSTHPHIFPQSFLNSHPETAALLAGWFGVPRLRRGHDVSGHVFLLTLSILFLADQLRSSFRARTSWSHTHLYAVISNFSLIALWLFASWVTSLYFHSPMEKVTGFLLGIASFAVTQIPVVLFPEVDVSQASIATKLHQR